MAITPFLAMTAAEIHAAAVLPEKTAWMACHFSPYGTGLSNLPAQLPAGSLLILNDRIPIHGHDLRTIEAQLQTWFENNPCQGLLLDFQRPDCRETALLAQHLCRELGCPVVLSEGYARDLDCPVFLPPLPHHVPLEEYLLSWKDREIWLELALDGEMITVTEEGCTISPLSGGIPENGHIEDALHCHYCVGLTGNSAEFILWRSHMDLNALLKEADKLGVATAVGLFQELGFVGRGS